MFQVASPVPVAPPVPDAAPVLAPLPRQRVLPAGRYWFAAALDVHAILFPSGIAWTGLGEVGHGDSHHERGFQVPNGTAPNGLKC